MKPAGFDYHAPGSLDEAVSLLAGLGDDAYPIAGGQSLVPLMNFRLVRPAALVDLNQIPELSYIRLQDGTLRVGSMTRQRELERNPIVDAACPMLPAATRFIGHFQIRNRGTLGGSIAHADPAAEYPAVAIAMGAEVVLCGPSGTRAVPAEQFFAGPFSTSRRPDELVVELRFPTVLSAVSVREVARRHGDFAIAVVAAGLNIREGRIEAAGIGLGGVGPTPLAARKTVLTLLHQPPSEELFHDAALTAALEASPVSDIHGSAEYRRSLVETLTFRALSEAAPQPSVGRVTR
jgi:CO/xanthine dehydrogenase FAD-binding subunit